MVVITLFTVSENHKGYPKVASTARHLNVPVVPFSRCMVSIEVIKCSF